MNLGFATETTKDTALDPLTEFREGVELLKKRIPPKGPGEIAVRSKATSKMLTTFRFLGCPSRVRNGSGIKPRTLAKWRYN
jgi:hypothetical protein